MDNAEILRLNERLKAASNLAFNLGGALLAAIAVKLFNEPTPDGAVVLWSIAMALLLWLAYMLLGLLEPEIVE